MGKKIAKKDPNAEREAEKYENPIPSREFIMEVLAESGRPQTAEQLIATLSLTEDDQQIALQRRLRAMVRDGQLLQNRRNAYGLIDKMELLKARITGHKDGFGFAIPLDGSDDLFLTARQMRTVFPDDEVLVRVANIDQRGRREGIIVDVLVRNTQKLVGYFSEKSGISFVKPSNQRIAQDITIPPGAELHAKDGQMVVVSIIDQPTAHMRAIGHVTEVLGDHMAPGMEISVALRNHDLPHEWPSDVLAEAARFSSTVSDDECKNRLDLRALPFVTIDGEDARDFDDAVFCQAQPKGGWILYVAIADVCHYVKPNTALDKEALSRGNSVYFPGQVIPMLPEALSNELCSLKPEVNRLTEVCEMHIAATGEIEQFHFHEAVIFSHARLTYTQVVEIVEQNNVALQTQYKNVFPHLKTLFAVFRTLHTARTQRGAIDFDLPETKIVFGENRKIERIVATTRNDAHRLIEECMLCANICAARFLTEKGYPGLFRVHEGPTETKLTDLRKFLGELGLKLPGQAVPKPRDYAELLDSISSRTDARLIQTVLLRSLSQAIYSPENKGHFGLAFDAYAHFTSPIRRYPDLLVHRAIRDILQKRPATDNLSAYYAYGEHCSMTERRADEATREVMDWLKCEFMQDKVGEEFPGIITSVTSFGLFVELTDIYVEGLVHISLLKNDYYQFDPIKQALSGEHSGKRYRLGDPIHILVARVDLDKRQIDFAVTDEIDGTRPSRKSSKKKDPKKPSSKNSKKPKKNKK